jgi:hypothetical protein
MAKTRNNAQAYKPTHSATNTYQNSQCFNMTNVKKLSDATNNAGSIGLTLGTTTRKIFNANNSTNGFLKSHLDKSKDLNGETSFRRIRSEITLKNLPLIKTFK